MNYTGIAKGKTIELKERLPYPEGESLSISVEPFGGKIYSGTPTAIQQAMHKSPHLTREDVDELERVIKGSKLPVHQESVFDKEM